MHRARRFASLFTVVMMLAAGFASAAAQDATPTADSAGRPERRCSVTGPVRVLSLGGCPQGEILPGDPQVQLIRGDGGPRRAGERRLAKGRQQAGYSSLSAAARSGSSMQTARAARAVPGLDSEDHVGVPGAGSARHGLHPNYAQNGSSTSTTPTCSGAETSSPPDARSPQMIPTWPTPTVPK